MSFKYQPKIEYENYLGVVITLTLPYPPEGDPENDSYHAKWQDNYTETGVHNRVPKYILRKFTLRLRFLDIDDVSGIKRMYEDVIMNNKSVKLFPDQANSAYHDVRIMSRKVEFKKMAYDDNIGKSENFYYSVDLNFELTQTP